MKTIFITSFHVLISRNILVSPVLELIQRRGIRVVCFIPEEKASFFKQEFGSSGVTIIGVPRHLRRRDVILRYLALACIQTQTLAIKRKTEMAGSGEWLVRVIGNRSWAQRMIRWLNTLLTPRGRFGNFFGQYHPDLVFSTDVQNENDVRLMREARVRGIPVVGMVRSWDNLTAKGLIRLVPDILIVNNTIIKAEAMRFHGIPERIIRVVGIPHYDSYTAGAVHRREEFSKLLSLDPRKRFILYAPTGDRYLDENRVDQYIVDFLSRIIPPTHQLIVRLPPTDSVILNVSSLPNVILHRPGKHLSQNPNVYKNNELTARDDEILRDTLAYSDLLVAGPSTIVIDAAVFDKPIILISFDGSASPPYYRSIRRYYDYNHFQPVLESGGVRVVKDADELREWLTRYLAHPEIDRAGREKIIREACWHLDGRSSDRLVEVLLERIHFVTTAGRPR